MIEMVGKITFCKTSLKFTPLPSSAELRLIIDKKKMQCPDDFAMFKCKIRGFDQVTHNVEEQFTEPINVS